MPYTVVVAKAVSTGVAVTVWCSVEAYAVCVTVDRMYVEQKSLALELKRLSRRFRRTLSTLQAARRWFALRCWTFGSAP